jgi:hypothetical protein
VGDYVGIPGVVLLGVATSCGIAGPIIIFAGIALPQVMLYFGQTSDCRRTLLLRLPYTEQTRVCDDEDAAQDESFRSHTSHKRVHSY